MRYVFSGTPSCLNREATLALNVDKPPFLFHLLDDFLLIYFPSSVPSKLLDQLTCTFRRLGVPLSSEKTIGPTRRVIGHSPGL